MIGSAAQTRAEDSSLTTARFEIWGGVECTVNRVRDSFIDQLELNGHDTRFSDVARFANLGLKTLRYPFVWERVQPDLTQPPDFRWCAERLALLRDAGIRPIAGLLHHGSGPIGTSLVDPEFPERFAAYARAFAERFPDVDAYTPINEPLTTARFSGLYGLWYPHARDPAIFGHALVNQLRGSVLAMRAIREVNPYAVYVQTEDLGEAAGTETLHDQVTFENDRRWLSFDLLMGRLGPDSRLWKFLIQSGLTESSLAWFAANSMAPDILGINHYLTSNRFLDDDLSAYPQRLHGGNGDRAYVDVDAIRIGDHHPTSVTELLWQTWKRYGRPIAVTECHLDSTREEQMRWFQHVTESARAAQRLGVDMRAVTAWGLLGHYDWDCFVTECKGYYESGVYDLRSPEPRATGLAKVVSGYAKDAPYEHPVLQQRGWWSRPSRAIYRVLPTMNPESWDVAALGPTGHMTKSTRPLLIIGSTGTLGAAFCRLCCVRGIPFLALARPHLDITDVASIERVLGDFGPWAVVNCAGYVNVDEAEIEPELCRRLNVDGPRNLARVCRAAGLPLVSFSSDLVFDGGQSVPYTESAPVCPLSVYGRSKADAERVLMDENGEQTLIVRTSAFFGPWDHYNFLTSALERLELGEQLRAADDLVVSPTYVPDLVGTTLNLLMDMETGVWHLANRGEMSWAALAEKFASRLGFERDAVRRLPAREMGYRASRPAYAPLGSERAMTLMPTFDDAFDRYFAECEAIHAFRKIHRSLHRVMHCGEVRET